MLEIEHLGVAVVLVIHATQVGIGIQHGLPGFHPVIFHQFSCDTDPGSVVESRNFRLGIGQQLSGSGLYLTGLDVELAFKDMGSTERTDSGLVTLHRCQIINTPSFKNLHTRSILFPPCCISIYQASDSSRFIGP